MKRTMLFSMLIILSTTLSFCSISARETGMLMLCLCKNNKLYHNLKSENKCKEKCKDKGGVHRFKTDVVDPYYYASYEAEDEELDVDDEWSF